MKRRVIILAFFLFLVVCLSAYLRYASSSGFQVVFFDVGQGDAALVRFGDGQKMLVDCGIGRAILPKLGDYLPFYDRTLDFLLITHFDSDHYGGCLDVLLRYDVKTIVENGARKDSDAYWREWDALAAAERARRVVIDGPTVWEIAGASMEFVAPDPELILGAAKSENNASVVFRLSRGADSFLFTGDMEMPLEEALLRRYCASDGLDAPCEALRADWLKVGHHGSGSSTGDDFLRAVAPSQAVISVGKNNFGHPSLRVLRRLQRARAWVWRTDQNGDILFP